CDRFRSDRPKPRPRPQSDGGSWRATFPARLQEPASNHRFPGCVCLDAGPQRPPPPARPGTRVRPRRHRPRTQIRRDAARSRECASPEYAYGQPAFVPLALAFGAPTLFHARRLAFQIAEEVQLAPADFGRSYDLELLNGRRMKRENALDALAKRYLAHGKRRASPSTVHADDDAFEDLNALLVALAHLHVHPNGVAGLHR